MAYLAPVPKLQFFDANGNPLSGGLLYTYAAGTTTPLATYTDSSGGTPNANPIVLNSRGEANVWLGSSSYKFKLTTSSNAEIWTVDNVQTNAAEVLTALAASGGSSLIGFLQSGTGATARTVQSKLRDFVSVKDFGAVGDGVTDDSTAIKAACDYGIANGKAIYVPAGTYICTYNVLSFTFATCPSKTFTLFGDGAASVLKMKDGVMTATFRVFVNLRPSIDMDLIEIHDIVFDNNARGSSPPPGPYDYEQSHTIRYAGDTGVTTKLLRYHNVVVKDPVADGMNNQGLGLINNWVISNCSEFDRTRTRASIQQSYMAENLVITGFTGARIESEPVATITTAKNVYISNCVVDILDMGGKTTPNLVTYFVTNSEVNQWMAIGYNCIKMNNCRIQLGSPGRFNYVGTNCTISDTTFLMDYDAVTGAVTGISLYGGVSEPHGLTFDNCRFLIDYDGALPVAATGYLVSSPTACAAASIENWQWAVKNCYFDPRAGGSVYCYRNGVWNLENNTYACATLTTSIAAVYHSHGNPTYAGRVTINGGDFRSVVGYGLNVSNTAASSQALGSLTLCGTMLGEAALNITKATGGSVSANDAYTNNSRRVQVAALTSYALNGDTAIIQAGNSALGSGVEYVATASSATAPAFRMTRQKGVKKDTTANRVSPSASDIGLLYLDTTLDADGKPIWWNGTAWVDATGATV